MERKRWVRAARNVGNDWRANVLDADLIMADDYEEMRRKMKADVHSLHEAL